MRDPYPTLFRRYLGSLVDGLLMLGALIGGGFLIGDVGPQFTWLRGVWLGFIILGYEPLFTSLSATVGQRLMGFRVRRHADPTRRIPIHSAYLRYAVKLFLGAISFFTMSISRQQRAIHDIAVGSVVITWPPVVIPGEASHRTEDPEPVGGVLATDDAVDQGELEPSGQRSWMADARYAAGPPQDTSQAGHWLEYPKPVSRVLATDYAVDTGELEPSAESSWGAEALSAGIVVVKVLVGFVAAMFLIAILAHFLVPSP